MPNRVVFEFLAKDKFTAASRKIKNANAKMKRSFGSLKKVADKTSTALKKLVGKLKYISVAAAAAAVKMVKSFGNIEAGLTSIYVLLDETDFKKYKKTIDSTITESMKNFGLSTEQSTKSLYNAISVLGASESTFKSYGAAIQLAIGGKVGGEINLASATLGVGKLMNAYAEFGLTGERAADIIFVTTQKGAATTDQLAKNVGKVGKMVAGLGVSAEAYVATIGEMTKFVSAEEAVTGIKAIVQAFIGAKGEAKKMLTEYGLPTTAKELEKTGWLKSMQRLNQMIDTNKDHVKIAIPAIEGYQAAMALSGGAVKNIEEMISLMGKGALARAFAMQMETLNQKTKIATQNLVLMADGIGEQLKPAILDLVAGIVWLHTKFTELSPAWKKAIAFTIVFVAVLPPLLLGLWLLIKAFGFVVAAITSVNVGLGIMSVTIGWIPLIIGGVLIALGLLIWKFDWVKEKIIGAYGAVKDFFGIGTDSGDIAVTGAADIATSSKWEGELTVKTPKGTTATMKTKTSGNSNTNFGTNMVGAS